MTGRSVLVRADEELAAFLQLGTLICAREISSAALLSLRQSYFT